MDANDELPELETAALEDLDLPLAPVEPEAAAPPPPPKAPPKPAALANPFDDPLPVAAAPKHESLSMDDLGGDDFDLPLPPPNAKTVTSPSVPRAVPPVAAAAQPKPLGAPSFGAFKPATPAFASGAVPKPFGASVAPAAPVPLRAAAAIDPKNLVGEDTTDTQSLRALLTSDTVPTQVPADIGRIALMLCRALVKKGVITPDDLA